ncbi:hypothetical protein FHS55_003564 [Angulomicrobium tetraedrale]|uniref:Uncharacterized protein n=1 Tax=Ancylobacter tetraedralis TaxID=217068 RepID=A0A839ZDV7_9HYPH|nr:hypothetical protein [Ancylobacter tetraedralis]MBB3772939.1 hypothetical protein [Ancylobacter tetraedralis]
MGYLALELWPYLTGALALGLATGWLSGCTPPRRPSSPETEEVKP